jgi:predicted metal-dependent HD superfamily phosphohydrolase
VASEPSPPDAFAPAETATEREDEARRVIAALAPFPLPEGLLDEAARAHRVGRRAYHDLSHVAEVARTLAAAQERQGMEPSRESFLAALFHDAVYQAGQPDNEARSAELARQAIARWLPDAAIDVERVAQLIRWTARHGHLTPDQVDVAAATFLDADMAILASPAEVFDRYDSAVAWEYAEVVTAEAWRAGRGRFLQGVLAAPRIFLGDDAHGRLDGLARANLARALAAVS